MIEAFTFNTIDVLENKNLRFFPNLSLLQNVICVSISRRKYNNITYNKNVEYCIDLMGEKLETENDVMTKKKFKT